MIEPLTILILIAIYLVAKVIFGMVAIAIVLLAVSLVIPSKSDKMDAETLR